MAQTANRRIALADRRQLLLARAALERVELRVALDEFRVARRPLAVAAGMLLRPGGIGSGSGVGGLLAQGLALFRQHPYLGSTLSLALGAMRGGAKGRFLRRAVLLGALAVAGVWAFATVARPPAD